MKKLSLIALGLVLVGAGCGAAVYEPSAQALNVTTASPGDTVLGMEVVSIEPFMQGEEVGPENAVVQFSGEVELMGEIIETKRADLNCMQPDEASAAKLPVIEGAMVEDQWFCFSGVRSEVDALGFEIGDEVNVVVKDYMLSVSTEELIDFAMIVEVK